MQVIPFKAEHVTQIALQPKQMYLSQWVTHDQAAALEQYPSFTGMVDGEVVGVMGVLPQWQGRALGWGLLSCTGPKNFVEVHRAVLHFLDGCYIQRIEATVDCDHEQGHRWIKMLGFELEAERMKAYAPDGHDCSLYARVL